MKQNWSVYLVMAAGLVSCRTADVIAPPISEQLALSVQERTPDSGEQVPRVTITGTQGAITVAVTRRGMCNTVVDAGINRAPGELAVVARMLPSTILRGCSMIVTVIDYSGTITDLPAGNYRVRVFEAVGPDQPRLIGSASVSTHGTIAIH